MTDERPGAGTAAPDFLERWLEHRSLTVTPTTRRAAPAPSAAVTAAVTAAVPAAVPAAAIPAAPPAPAIPAAAPAPQPAAAPPAPAPAPAPAQPETREPAAPPPVVALHPQRRSHRMLGLLLLGSLAPTALTAYAARLDPTTPSLGVAAACAVLTLVLWAVRATTSTATVVVDHGVLDIRADGSHHRFDLTGRHGVPTVVGEPGERGWQVRFERRGLAPYVIDRRMVDPTEFMAVLRRFHPEP